VFADTKTYSGFAVDDLRKARQFYGETLGLQTSEEYGLMWLHLAGGRDMAGCEPLWGRGQNGLVVRVDPQTEGAVLDILERFCSGFEVQDADAIVELFAPDSDVVMVTSEQPLLRGLAEVRAFLERYASGTTTYSWRWHRRDVFAAGAVGWLLAEGVEIAAAGDHEQQHPYRMSMVCEKRDGRWLLMQVHGSSPHDG
jgi:uncharacterized protein (TIGR02246 family)